MNTSTGNSAALDVPPGAARRDLVSRWVPPAPRKCEKRGPEPSSASRWVPPAPKKCEKRGPAPSSAQAPLKKQKSSGISGPSGPTKRCSSCRLQKERGDYSKTQWKKADRNCKPCMEQMQARNRLEQSLNRHCNHCRKSKPKDVFVPKKENPMRMKYPLVCKHCLPAVEQEQRILLEEQERIQEESRQARLARQRHLESYGKQAKMNTFEVPGESSRDMWSSDHEDFDDEDSPFRNYQSPGMEFKGVNEIPRLETLVGTYDLIFFFTYGSLECHQNRATKGTLELAVDNNDNDNNDETLQLKGVASLDPSVRRNTYVHEDDVEFVLKMEETSAAAGKMELRVSNLDDLYNFNGFDDDVRGHVQVVARRTAVRFMSEDNGERAHHRAYARSVRYDTAERAQMLLREYRDGVELPWVTRLMRERTGVGNVPPELSKIIGAFATSKPPPVMMFEEGDLWLFFNWCEDNHGGGFGTYLVARRRK